MNCISTHLQYCKVQWYSSPTCAHFQVFKMPRKKKVLFHFNWFFVGFFFVSTAAQLRSFSICAYRIGSFTPTPSWGSPPTPTASGMHFPVSLVHLLDGGARGGSPRRRSSAPRESSRHPPGHPSCALVQLGDDGVANLLQLLLLVLKLLLLSRLQEKQRAQRCMDTAQGGSRTAWITHSNNPGCFSHTTKPQLH